ncbi:RICIN domain-containing protein [Paenibacillus glycanilyticus]|uniref:RICIN domain-containing protein n=1 Tax=Paenibacillus glycanilyticus TaxID=126569 RepID=UPI00203E0881|nr:RICIN domain-containing protein [Paenibacillus glycanilyticus]MCM3631167.1 RICIN domain-containing protein [Paenibacillus glycanilyticus]
MANLLPRTFLSAMLAVLLFASTLVFVQPASAASQSIVNNSNGYDTDGNLIYAQGGWMMQEGNTFYWYGMDFSTAGVKKVSLYTSTDFKNWTKHANIVDFSTINPKLDSIQFDPSVRFAHSQWVGRPLVQYNSELGKYVLLAEWNNNNTRNKLAIFTSAAADGPFTFEKVILTPGGWTMGDLGSIFTDSDGSTYITYTTDYNNDTNHALQISKLTSDYMDLDGAPTKTFIAYDYEKEATSLIKIGSTYYLFASQTNGWGSSQTFCFKSTSLTGSWSSESCATSPSSANSFDTQVDQVFPLHGSEGTAYIYIGDRWLNFGGSTGVGRNQFYPVSFDSAGKPTINGYAQWQLDASAGTWSAPPLAGTLQMYAVVNGNSGKALGVAGNSLSSGATLEQQPYTGAVSQAWKLVNGGSGNYKLQNANSGFYLDVASASTSDGAAGVQWTASSEANQLWQLIDAGGGYFKIKNAKSGKMLCMSQGSTANGAPVIQWAESGSTNQTWRFDSVAQLDLTKTYSITNRNSSKSLGTAGDASADGTQVEQRTYSGAVSQAWQFEYAGGYYKIKNVNSGKYMDIAGASTADGANNIIATAGSSTSQQWQLVDAGGGYYTLKNRNSGKLLGISAGNTADGGVNIQWTATGSLNQNWSFTVIPT